MAEPDGLAAGEDVRERLVLEWAGDSEREIGLRPGRGPIESAMLVEQPELYEIMFELVAEQHAGARQHVGLIGAEQGEPTELVQRERLPAFGRFAASRARTSSGSFRTATTGRAQH